MITLDVLFTPAELALLPQRDLAGTVCVVFDVLRATSTMVTALWNGAQAVLPVAEIADAVEERRGDPATLLAGERDGVRIPPELAGGVGFDLGNSPREFTARAVRGKTVVMTTTNGTRALRACSHARMIAAAAFLNLGPTAKFIDSLKPFELLLICSGTYNQSSYEDVLAAGALCDLVWAKYRDAAVSDSALMARRLFLEARRDLAGSIATSRNGRRLLSHPELKEDVAFCSQRDLMDMVAVLEKDGRVRKQT